VAKRGGKKAVRRNVARAIANIKATFNNTLVTITDVNGEVLSRASAGTVGFKGTRKSTLSLQRAVEQAAHAAHAAFRKWKSSERPRQGATRRSRHYKDQGCDTPIEDITPLPTTAVAHAAGLS
jgi:small subunit ribosomal protein S11